MNGNDDASSERTGPEDLGEPITQLLGHAVPVASDFRARVGRSIERRLLAADAAQLSMMGPIATLLELLRALFESLGLIDPESAASPDDVEESQ